MSPFLNLDVAGTEVRADDISDVNEVRSDVSQGDDFDVDVDVGGDVGVNANVNVSVDELPEITSSERSDKLQQECREVLREIREVTFLLHDISSLKGLRESLTASVPKDDGIMVLPSPKKVKVSAAVASKKMVPQDQRDPINKLRRKKCQSNPFAGRHGQVAAVMKTNFKTSIPIEQMSQSSSSKASSRTEIIEYVSNHMKVKSEDTESQEESMLIDEMETEGGTEEAEEDKTDGMASEGNTTDEFDEEMEGEADAAARESERVDIVLTESGEMMKRHQKQYARHGKTGAAKTSTTPVTQLDSDTKDTDVEVEHSEVSNTKWQEIDKIPLTKDDKCILQSNRWINDKIINAT